MRGNRTNFSKGPNRNSSKFNSLNSRRGKKRPQEDNISDIESSDGSQSDRSYDEPIGLDSDHQHYDLDAGSEEEVIEEEPEQSRSQSRERTSRKKPKPMPTTIEGLDERINELKRRQETLSLLKNKQHRRSLFENIRHQIIRVWIYLEYDLFYRLLLFILYDRSDCFIGNLNEM